MPAITLNVCLADIKPMNEILDVLSELMNDDRIPADYRIKLNRALNGWIDARPMIYGKDGKIDD